MRQCHSCPAPSSILLAGNRVLAETFRRFDKTDKNAAPIEAGMYKFSVEQLGDGSPVLVAVFLDVGTKAEEFASKVQIGILSAKIH